MDSETVVRRAPDLLSTVVGDEAVLLSLETGTYFGTNAVGTHIWQLIVDPLSVDAICAAIRAEFGVDATRCERDVLIFLERLEREGLVVTE